MVGAGVAVLAIPMAHSFYVLACSVGMYGLCLGCWFLLVPVLLADQYGTDKISSSYGLVRMFQSFGAISIPPLTGTSISRKLYVAILFQRQQMLFNLSSAFPFSSLPFEFIDCPVTVEKYTLNSFYS